MNHHQVTGLAPHRMCSLRKIRACDFGQPKCRPLQAEARYPFLPRRCERGADWAPLHGCKASQDGPLQSLPNMVGRLHSLASTDERQPICHVGPYFAPLNRGKSCTNELLAEIPEPKTIPAQLDRLRRRKGVAAMTAPSVTPSKTAPRMGEVLEFVLPDRVSRWTGTHLRARQEAIWLRPSH